MTEQPMAACCQRAWTVGARTGLAYLILTGLVDLAAARRHLADLAARPKVIDVNALDTEPEIADA